MIRPPPERSDRGTMIDQPAISIVAPPSVFYQPARSASERLFRLVNGKTFNFSKGETLLQKLKELTTTSEINHRIALDSFLARAHLRKLISRPSYNNKGSATYGASRVYVCQAN